MVVILSHRLNYQLMLWSQAMEIYIFLIVGALLVGLVVELYCPYKLEMRIVRKEGTKPKAVGSTEE